MKFGIIVDIEFALQQEGLQQQQIFVRNNEECTESQEYTVYKMFIIFLKLYAFITLTSNTSEIMNIRANNAKDNRIIHIYSGQTNLLHLFAILF